MQWIVIAFGIFIRLRQFFFDRSLWLDEALLARNIIERSFASLCMPLQYDQNAPIGFLLISKVAAIIGGNSSMALRFVPLLAGIASLFLFWRVSSLVLQKPGRLLALLLFALSTPMVYYSTEFKQYMGDVFFALFLVYVCCVVRVKPVWKIIIGAVVIWFSHASVFVLAAIALTDRRTYQTIAPWWLASFLLDYWVALRFNLSGAIIENWKGLFLLFPWQSNMPFDTFLITIGRMIGFFFDVEGGIVYLAVLIAGMLLLWQREKRAALVFFLPMFFVLVASGVQRYPFVPRLLLFTAPAMYIAFGAVFDWLTSQVKKRFGRVAHIMVAVGAMWFIFSGVGPEGISHATTSIKMEELGQVITYMHTHYEEGDVVYVYYAAETPFLYYAKPYPELLSHVIIGNEFRRDMVKYQSDVERVRRNARVWIVFSHIYRQQFFGEDRFIVGYLDTIGKRLDYFPQVGASVYLYDLR